MAQVVVFHHALGLTPGVVAFADALRAAGHDARTPDLFEGRRFEEIEDGVAHAEEVGFGTVLERGVTAAADAPPGTVYVGFSLGVLPAQRLAQTRAGAGGAVLVSSCVPVAELSERWPEGVPVQVHAAEDDPWFVEEPDADAARALVAEAATVGEGALYWYPGGGHLFADSSHASYDPVSAALLQERVLALLARVDAGRTTLA